MKRTVARLHNLIKRLKVGWYGEAHEGWGEQELEPIVEEVTAAKARHRECANVMCYSRPMSGSIFCWDCMMAPTVRCVKLPRSKWAAGDEPYGEQHVAAFDVLIHYTTLMFTRLEVQYSVMFDEMLVGTGAHAA
jgi:hypothetical protein